MGDDRANNGRDEKLDRYADEVGINANSLRTYRDVAAAWPEPNRLGSASWKVHSMLMRHQHLIREGMTVTQAHAAPGHATTGRTGPHADAESRALAVREMLYELPDL